MQGKYILMIMSAIQGADASLRKKQQLPPLATEAHARSQSNTTWTVTLSEVSKHELHELLHIFVEEALHVEPLAAFKPKCLEHVKKLIHSIDHAYTDVQLQTALENECKLAKEFPNSQKSGYKSHDKCMEFAKKLAAARDQELKTGDTAQYEQFCEDYHEHLEKDPVVPPSPAPALKANCSEPINAPQKAAPKKEVPEKKSSAQSAGVFAVLTAVTVTALCA